MDVVRRLEAAERFLASQAAVLDQSAYKEQCDVFVMCLWLHPRGERTRDRALRDCHDFVLDWVLVDTRNLGCFF